MSPYRPFCAGFFDNARQAEQAIGNLIAVGYSRDEMTVIVPEPFRDTLTQTIPRAEPPSRRAPEQIIQGALIGAALGAIALVAAMFLGDGFGLLAGAMVLIGGGAIAGGFASLILEEGYETGIGEYHSQAMNTRQIVVGVHVDAGDESDFKLVQAARILKEAGASSLAPQHDPTKHPPAEKAATGGGAFAGV